MTQEFICSLWHKLKQMFIRMKWCIWKVKCLFNCDIIILYCIFLCIKELYTELCKKNIGQLLVRNRREDWDHTACCVTDWQRITLSNSLHFCTGIIILFCQLIAKCQSNELVCHICSVTIIRLNFLSGFGPTAHLELALLTWHDIILSKLLLLCLCK